MRFKSLVPEGESRMWPVGIHWTAGEVRDVPEDYPGADGDPPKWLEPVKPPKKRKPKAEGEDKPEGG